VVMGLSELKVVMGLSELKVVMGLSELKVVMGLSEEKKWEELWIRYFRHSFDGLYTWTALCGVQ
jgi:hypothetical protein